ncbi:MAG: exostosin family protein [Ferruginibacter sp.]
MRLFLTSAYFYLEDFNAPKWLMLNSKDSSMCTNDPELADAIIFVESHPVDDPYFRTVLAHPLFKKYRHKCVLYHDADLSVTALPTLSPSIESWQFNPRHKRPFHYIARFTENKTIDAAPVIYNTDHKYLYSFIGARNHPLRNEILSMNHPADSFIKDTFGINAWDLNEADKVKFEQDFIDVINESSFVLCPRGIGPCSYRLFETMQLGRVPVIISDEWVPIPNIDWDRFTITVPESKIALIPQILNERKNEALEMGRLARKYWEECFSPEVSLQHMAKAAKELLGHNYSFIDSLKDYSQFIQRPWHIKNFLRYKKNKMKEYYKKAKLKKRNSRHFSIGI